MQKLVPMRLGGVIMLFGNPPKQRGCKNKIFSVILHEEVLMKMTRYSEPQIIAILRQAEGGVTVSELCHEQRISNVSFYKWRSKYGPIDEIKISEPV